MEIKLNDFTSQQLQVLLNVVVAKIVDEDLHRKEWIKYFSRLGGYYETQPERAKEYETLQLFRVQILNAIVDVKSKEIVNSN
jgi:hypothetical protein